MVIANVAKRHVSPPSEHAGKQIAYFTTRRLPPSTAVVSAHGELDAANAPEFTKYSLSRVAPNGKLILDLNAVDFFGTACFAALHTLNVRCIGEGACWALTPSKAVSRVLRICDPDSTIPTCPTVSAALSMLGDDPRPLQLVAESH